MLLLHHLRNQQAAEAFDEVGGHLQEGVAVQGSNLLVSIFLPGKAAQGRASEVVEDEVFLAACFW